MVCRDKGRVSPIAGVSVYCERSATMSWLKGLVLVMQCVQVAARAVEVLLKKDLDGDGVIGFGGEKEKEVK